MSDWQHKHLYTCAFRHIPKSSSVLVLSSRRLVHPVADDDFITIIIDSFIIVAHKWLLEYGYITIILWCYQLVKNFAFFWWWFTESSMSIFFIFTWRWWAEFPNLISAWRVFLKSWTERKAVGKFGRFWVNLVPNWNVDQILSFLGESFARNGSAFFRGKKLFPWWTLFVKCAFLQREKHFWL